MTELKDLLQEGATRAKLYDVTERAWANGRRRRRMRRAVASAVTMTVVGAMAVGLMLAIGGPPVPREERPVDSVAALHSCEVEQLPLPAGYATSSLATTVDPTGRFIGGKGQRNDGRHSLLLWDNGKVQILPIDANAGSSIQGINRHGDLVAVLTGDHPAESQYYSGGRWTNLHGPGAVATGLNGNGVVVGYLGPYETAKPVVWPTPTAQPQALALPAGAVSGRAHGITDDGYIVGWIVEGQPVGAGRPAVWTPQGVVRLLRVPGEEGGIWHDRKFRLAGRFVDAELDAETEPPRYYRFDVAGGEGVKLGTDDGNVIAFLPAGWQLVYNAKSRLIMASGGVRTELPTLPNRTPWPIPSAGGSAAESTAAGVSDDGRVVVGYQALVRAAQESAGELVATAWRCH